MIVDTTSLPSDVSLCHEMIHALAEELHQKDQKLERLQNHIQMLLHRYYGPRAERFDPNQGLLLPKEELSPVEESDPSEDEPVEEPARPDSRRSVFQP